MKIDKFKHLPLMITGIRIIGTPIFITLILTGQYRLTILVFIIICLSDLFDGIVARALELCTSFGACMDVTADAIYIFSAIAFFYHLGITPMWFLMYAGLKLLEFVITSSILKSQSSKREPLIFDILGKAFAILLFIYPGFVIVSVYLLRLGSGLNDYYLGMTLVLGLVSSVFRLLKCKRLIILNKA